MRPREPCTSPFQAGPLEDGAHSFAVFAEDAERLARRPDAGPAQLRDRQPPKKNAKNSKTKTASMRSRNARKKKPTTAACLPKNACCAPRARASSPTRRRTGCRLVIRYTAFVPADVDVDYRLIGGQGPLQLGTAHQHFAKCGLLRVNEQAQRRRDGQGARREALHRPARPPGSAPLLPPLRHQAPDDQAHHPRPARLVPVRLGLRRPSRASVEPAGRRGRGRRGRSGGRRRTRGTRPRGHPPRAARGRGGRSRSP